LPILIKIEVEEFGVDVFVLGKLILQMILI